MDKQDPKALKKREQEQAGKMSFGGALSLADLVFDRDDFINDRTPMDKLDTVMTKAKESGMSVEKIFEFFTPNNEKEISLANFTASLQKLGPAFFDFSAEEIETVFDMLDTDNSKTIDPIEFRDHCYLIPRLAWKAERIRLEKLKNAPATAAPAGSAAAAEPTPPADQSQVHTTIKKATKLFWRTQERVYVVVKHYPNLDCYLVTASKTSDRVDYPPTFVNAKKLTLVEGDVEKQLEASRAEFQMRANGAPVPEEKMASIEVDVRNDMLMNMLLLRLQQVEATDGQAERLKFSKLVSDTDERCVETMDNPGIRDIIIEHEEQAVDMEAFQRKAAEVQRMSGDMARYRTAARRSSSKVRKSMDTFGGVFSGDTKVTFTKEIERLRVEVQEASKVTAPDKPLSAPIEAPAAEPDAAAAAAAVAPTPEESAPEPAAVEPAPDSVAA